MVGTEWGGEKARGTDDTFYVDQHGDLVEVEGGGAEEGLDEGGDGGAKASVGDTATWGTAYSLGDLEVAMRHYLDVRSELEKQAALSTLLAPSVLGFPIVSNPRMPCPYLCCECLLSTLLSFCLHRRRLFSHIPPPLSRLVLLTIFFPSHPAAPSFSFAGCISEGAVRRNPR